MTFTHTRLTALLTASVLLLTTSTAQAFTACTKTVLTSGDAVLPEEQQDPATVGNNDIYFAYRDKATGLVFRQSHDAGATWSQFLVDSNGAAPRIVAVQKHVYLVWYSVEGGTGSLNFMHSEDAGATFSSAQNLGNAIGEIPQVATSGPLVSIIWGSGGSHVTVATSANAGKTFTTVDLSSLPKAEEMWIEALGKNISVVWTGTGTDGYAKNIVSYSTDAGQTFAPPVSITADGISAVEPQMAVSETTGMFYMVWREEHSSFGPSVGFLSKSTDFGKTWSRGLVIDPNDDRSRQFAIAAAGHYVYLTYMDFGPAQNWTTRLKISSQDGTHFGPHILIGLSGITGQLGNEAHAPRLWAENKQLRIIYDQEGWVSIRSSNNNGTTISAPTKLGGGDQMLLSRNTALWLDDNGMAMFGLCH
jgi:hypothetical protein